MFIGPWSFFFLLPASVFLFPPLSVLSFLLFSSVSSYLPQSRHPSLTSLDKMTWLVGELNEGKYRNWKRQLTCFQRKFKERTLPFSALHSSSVSFISLSLIFTSTSLPLSIFCPKANLFIHGRKLMSSQTCTQICPSSKWLHWNYISHESAMRSIYTSISLLSSHNVFSLCLIQYQSVCCSVSPPHQCSLLYINGLVQAFKLPQDELQQLYCDVVQHLQGTRFIYLSF